MAGTPQEPVTRLAAALEQLKEHQALLAQWEAARAGKQAELDDLEPRIGPEVLAAAGDAGAVAERLTAQVNKLRTGIEIDSFAALAAADQVRATARVVLQAEADDLRAELAPAQRAFAQHEARTKDLLEQLQQHDHVPYAPKMVDVDQLRRETGGSYSMVLPRTHVLGEKVRQLIARVALLELAAAGQPVPYFVESMVIPAELYSPRFTELRDLLPDLQVTGHLSAEHEAYNVVRTIAMEVTGTVALSGR